MLWLIDAIFLSHSRFFDSLNLHNYRIKSTTELPFSKISDLLFTSYEFPFCNNTISPLRDNDKTTSIFCNDSRAFEISFSFLKESELISVC